MAFLEKQLQNLFVTSADGFARHHFGIFFDTKLSVISGKKYVLKAEMFIEHINAQENPLKFAEVLLRELNDAFEKLPPQMQYTQLKLAAITNLTQTISKIGKKIRENSAQKRGRASNEAGGSGSGAATAPTRPPASSPGSAPMHAPGHIAGKIRQIILETPVSTFLRLRTDVIANYFNTKNYEKAATEYAVIYETIQACETLTEQEKQRFSVILLNDIYEARCHRLFQLFDTEVTAEGDTIEAFKREAEMSACGLEIAKTKLLETVEKAKITIDTEDTGLNLEYSDAIRALACNKLGYSVEEMNQRYKKCLWVLADNLCILAASDNKAETLDLILSCNLLQPYSVKHTSSRKTASDVEKFKTKVLATRNTILLKPITDLEAKADAEADELSAVILYQWAVRKFTDIDLAEVKGETSPLKKGLALANSVFFLWKDDEKKELIRHVVEGSVYYFLALLPKLNALTEEQLSRKENELTADDLLDFLVSMYQYIAKQTVLIPIKKADKDSPEVTRETNWTEKWGATELATALGKPPLDYLADLLAKFTPTCKAANISLCGVGGKDAEDAEKILRERGLLVVAPGMSL